MQCRDTLKGTWRRAVDSGANVATAFILTINHTITSGSSAHPVHLHIIHTKFHFVDRGSSVGIATHYGLDGPGIDSSDRAV